MITSINNRFLSVPYLEAHCKYKLPSSRLRTQRILLSKKQMFFFQANSGEKASIYGSARMLNAEGFSSSGFSEANWLVGL